jgi:carbon-monoxide dehydrogenase medium subunit
VNNFAYAAPTSLAEACALLADTRRKVRPLAGGTDLIVQLREGLREADLVVDVKKIPELAALHFDPAQGLTLGAAVPCARLYENKAIARAYPALAEAAHIVGGWQIQSRASIGGNLCNASPAADTIPPLIVHRAVCRIVGPRGERQVPASEFCTGPGKHVLAPGELLVALHLPPPAARASSAYERFIPRNEMDIAVVGAAAWLALDAAGQTIVDASIALAAVAPKPVWAEAASRWLLGQPVGADTWRHAGELARQASSPISDMRGTAEFRRHLVGVLVERTLAEAARRALGPAEA